MKAILTRYLPATNTKPSRIRATAEGGKPLTVGYYAAPDNTDPFAFAARQLADRMGWTGPLLGGGLPDGSTCWVFARSHMTA